VDLQISFDKSLKIIVDGMLWIKEPCRYRSSDECFEWIEVWVALCSHRCFMVWWTRETIFRKSL